jgi:hypothetical protein
VAQAVSSILYDPQQGYEQPPGSQDAQSAAPASTGYVDPYYGMPPMDQNGAWGMGMYDPMGWGMYSMPPMPPMPPMPDPSQPVQPGKPPAPPAPAYGQPYDMEALQMQQHNLQMQLQMNQQMQMMHQQMPLPELPIVGQRRVAREPSSADWKCACGWTNRPQNTICGGVKGAENPGKKYGCGAPRPESFDVPGPEEHPSKRVKAI